ncbi:hypothetical protein C922_04425 [Plasmodium inui San Antonio 1]|uniref:Uncharacterized protein n=1 Tax=Plasmodium inui San Antonio 1 TaxID=1237626 RepID=W7A7P3_9APIC|nr:hypothetical protein C922_04425 [Plasmodium inui San Antonio 1]EUD65139.1 hypothetical protein C922_04425 [Plasmodium inui San Antonio 1]
MKISTLWNIAIFTILLSKVVHIALVKFAPRKERKKFSSSILWKFFETTGDEYKGRILTEEEEKNMDDSIENFIRDNNVNYSDTFVSLINTTMLEDIDVNGTEITESKPIKEDTEEEKKKKKRTRRYRACCKVLGHPCKKHNKKGKNVLTKENAQATTAEEGNEKVEEKPIKTRKRTTPVGEPTRFSKRLRRKYRGKSSSESEENTANTEEPVLVPKVPTRKYENIFLTEPTNEMVKEKNMKLLEIHSYKVRTSNNSEINKLQAPGISDTDSDDKELDEKKTSEEPNFQIEENKHNLQYGIILSEVGSERNIENKDSQGDNDKEESQENSDKKDSGGSDISSESSHEEWKETENEEKTDSDTETSSEALEQEELDEKKTSLVPNIQFKQNRLNLWYLSNFRDVGSEGNIENKDSQKDTHKEDSGSLKNSSQSSYEKWRNTENEENTESDSDGEKSSGTSEEELQNLQWD